MTIQAEDGCVLQRTLVGTDRVETKYTPKQARALASVLVKVARMADAERSMSQKTEKA